MSHEVMERINEMASNFPAEAENNESLGRLSDVTAATIRKSGVMRLLQLKEYGGYEAHPNDFFKSVMEIASQDPSAGWISGVVGCHPWEAAFNDSRLLDELWTDDSDVWMASPYAPMGVAKPVDGGYIFNGRWTFSSGTDHCDWVVLGALLGDDKGAPAMPPRIFHIMLPRSDYELLEGTWDVVGLQGTGSKDVVVKDAFIPDYRALEFSKVLDGTSYKEMGRENPLYAMPWSAVFPCAIASAVLGICEGAMRTGLEYQKDRIVMGGPAKEDPCILSVIGEAMAEIRSSRATMLFNIDEMFDLTSAGKEVSLEMRASGRRDQVRGAWRAVRAVNEIFTRCGGTALHKEFPMHRFWRDANAGLNHAVFTTGPAYHGSTSIAMGCAAEGLIAKMIV